MKIIIEFDTTGTDFEDNMIKGVSAAIDYARGKILRDLVECGELTKIHLKYGVLDTHKNKIGSYEIIPEGEGQ